MPTTMMAMHVGASMRSLALLQETLNSGNTKWLMIFVGMAAFALVGQAVAILTMAVGAVRAQKHIAETIDELKTKLLPVVAKANVLIAEITVVSTDLAPRIRNISEKMETISGHAEAISAMLEEKVAEFGPTMSAANVTVQQANETVREANRRTQQQVARVNGMVTDILDATAQVGKAIQHGIDVPVREVSAILSGVKVGLLSFFGGPARASRPVYRGPVGTFEPVVEDRRFED